MRGLVFTTRTPDCEKLVRSFTSIVPDTAVERYDVFGFDVGHAAQIHRPDVIVYIGACMPHNDGCPIPTIDALCRANAVAPMIHICSDAADPPWWPLLEEYNAIGAFRLQVTIDGQRDCPIGRFGLVALTPVDPGSFPSIPWADRNCACGFAGGGGARTPMLHRLRSVGLHWVNERGYGPYNEVCSFYAHCKLIINDAKTGTGQRRHIKGRVVEAGLASAVILEPTDSPLREWFEPGTDFLEYGSVDEAESIIRSAPGRDAELQQMAARFHEKVLARHAAPPFWADIFERIGLTELGAAPPQGDPSAAVGVGASEGAPPVPLPPIFTLPPNPMLIETIGSLNLVSYAGGVYVLPHRLGSLDLANDMHRRRAGVVRCETLEEARNAAAWLR